MTVIELVKQLIKGEFDARIVLQLPDSSEIDVTSAKNHCQLFVLTADIPEPEKLDNSAHIEEAMTQYPAEDFLENVIRACSDDELREELEAIQSEIARAVEYGRNELRLALKEIEK